MIDPSRIAVALDVLDTARAITLVRAIAPHTGIRWFKVGLSLFIHGGPDFVRRLREEGARVFLDLKLHDIPHQVRLATEAARSLNVDLLTVHASGGVDMMRAAADAAADAMKVVAVTVLTSQVADTSAVVRIAESAAAAGVHGVVCSPREAAAVRSTCGPSFFLVTPGIRAPGAATDDQQRTATPTEAITAGADLLVIGRPITGAADPASAALALLQ